MTSTLLIAAAPLAALLGLMWLIRAYQRRHRPAASPQRDIAFDHHRLPDDFHLRDLPFGSFHFNSVRMEHEPVACVPSPFGGRQWAFRVVSSAGRARTCQSFTLLEVPEAWPHVGLERRDTDALGMPNEPEVPFLGDHRFDKLYVVRSSDAGFATAFFPPGLRQWLLDHQVAALLEVSAGYLLVTVNARLDEDLLRRLMTWSQELLERTPLTLWPNGERKLVHLDS